ncbi:MAG: carbohydrate kinase family protein [Candidatus Hadarchaeota archaeon]
MVLAIGDINVDIIARTSFPPKGKQVVAKDFELHGGGCAANFALACARLGVKSKLIGKVGADEFGEFALKQLKKGGVDVLDVMISEGRTGVTVAVVEGKERSFITFRGENATFSKSDILVDRLDYDIIHMPSFFLLESLRPSYSLLAAKAKKQGACLTSLDTGWDPFGKWWRTEFLAEALKNFDVFLPNLDEARGVLRAPTVSERALVDRVLEAGPRIVAIKRGSKGSIVGQGTVPALPPKVPVLSFKGPQAVKQEKKFAKVKPFKVEVVDTTGAGDVFNAAFLLAYMYSKDIITAATFANAAAALSVTGPGWSGYPGWSQVNAYLRKNGLQQVWPK